MKRILSALLCAVTVPGLLAGVAAQKVQEVDYSLYSTYYVLESGEVVAELKDEGAQPEEDGAWRASQAAAPIEDAAEQVLTFARSAFLRHRVSVDAIEKVLDDMK